MKSGRSDTIIALSSGATPSGIAVVRVSGPQAHAVAEAFGATDLAPRHSAVRTLRSPSDGAAIDQALCLRFDGPASATGEDVVEFHTHGSPAVVERILSEAVTLPAVRTAEPGEFTLRAVLSGRMGLTDAEALADLLDARTEAERRRAVRLSGGELGRYLADWRARLIEALALCEAHLDFADESDVVDDAAVDALLPSLRQEVLASLSTSRDAEKLTDGFRIALVGAPNAGKSSLINALAGQSVALVSPEAGTTRDIVSVTLDLGGYKVVIADTAGVRAGAQGVEAMGIARTKAEAATADLVVDVRSPDTAPIALDRADLVVGHKADLGDVAGANLSTSTRNQCSIAAFAERLSAEAAAGLAGAENAILTRARQRSACAEIADALDEALGTAHLELKAEALRAACIAVGRLTGDVGVEEILDDVFGRFCIGK